MSNYTFPRRKWYPVGKFDFDIPVEWFKQVGRLEEVDKYAPQMINEAVPILVANIKSEMSKHRRTGDMVNSVKVNKAGKRNKNGNYYAWVGPTGTDSKGVRNMEKLAHAEYGTKKQPPTPILTKALKDSEKAVLDKMQEVFTREVSKN